MRTASTLILIGALALLVPAPPPQPESSRLLAAADQDVWQGTVTITFDSDLRSQRSTTAMAETAKIRVRLREIAVLYVEHEGRIVGAFTVFEDYGSSAFAQIGGRMTFSGVQCDTMNRSVANDFNYSGGVLVERFGGWLYRSFDEDEPLHDRLDGVYSLQGDVSGRLPGQMVHDKACGGTETLQAEQSFNKPIGIGLDEIDNWRTIKGNASSHVVWQARHLSEKLMRAEQWRRGRGRAAFLTTMSDRERRRLANANLAGTYLAPATTEGGSTTGTMKARGDWRIDHAPDPINAVLTALGSDEPTYLPWPDDARRYQLELIDPGPEEIEAVRFVLDDVSSHPGIATNAGYHVFPGNCLHHGGGVTRDLYDVTTGFGSPARGDTITRSHRGYDGCVLDELPDIFFRDVDNPELDLEEPNTLANYAWSLSLIREGVDTETVAVWVAFNDSGAAARLRAEVRIGDVWYAARAEGDTAAADTSSLLLPLDEDGDGIHDRWERDRGIDDPRADEDTHPGAGFIGDGLTNFEEYRGVYADSYLRRSDPRKKTLFVYDDSGVYGPYLRPLVPKFDTQGVQLLVLREHEFRDEVVNAYSGDARGGEQYALIMMDGREQFLVLSLRRPHGGGWGFAGMASDIGPPRRDANTVILDPARHPADGTVTAARAEYLVGLIGHEIGHQINLPHHGNRDAKRRIGDTTYAIAVQGGQHSGNIFCFMIYRSASRFCAAPDAAACDDEDLVELPRELVRREIICDSRAGTGFNSAGAWAGDATNGNCLSRLNVRSW